MTSCSSCFTLAITTLYHGISSFLYPVQEQILAHLHFFLHYAHSHSKIFVNMHKTQIYYTQAPILLLETILNVKCEKTDIVRTLQTILKCLSRYCVQRTENCHVQLVHGSFLEQECHVTQNLKDFMTISFRRVAKIGNNMCMDAGGLTRKNFLFYLWSILHKNLAPQFRPIRSR